MTDHPDLVCVDPLRVLEFWPHVESFIDKACERFGSNDERLELEDSVKSGRALLWLAWSSLRSIEAALITDIVKEDDYKVCRLRALAGKNAARWIALLARIEQFAQDEGCRFTKYVGRRGWVMMLGNEYKITHVIAQKRLRD